jgi:type VI secretion system protein ImpB
MAESEQSSRTRVRPRRVHITYDVEVGGAIEKRELPFVVGVLADLSHQPEQPLPRLQHRKFVTVDADNFDAVMDRMAPRARLKVENRLTEDGYGYMLAVELRFRRMRDFEPEEVASQIAPLRELLERRRRLVNLRSALNGNHRLDEMLQNLADRENLSRVAAELGLFGNEGKGGEE